MNKIMVQLYIPVTGKSYDLLLPRSLSVGEATELIADFFKKESDSAYFPDEAAVLCDRETGRIYPVNTAVEELKLQNGSKLMLI